MVGYGVVPAMGRRINCFIWRRMGIIIINALIVSILIKNKKLT